MFCYPVSYEIRSDNVLVKSMNQTSSFNRYLSFDSYFQIFSSEKNYERQINERVLFCIRTTSCSIFFVFDKLMNLHLFNSRAEVTRFLKEIDM